jgi:hypothetical protein
MFKLAGRSAIGPRYGIRVGTLAGCDGRPASNTAPPPPPVTVALPLQEDHEWTNIQAGS